MPRTLSSLAKQALFAQETGEVFLALLTISHPELLQPLRFVNNTQAIVSRGQNYTAWPFEIVLPGDQEAKPPVMTLKIDNVDREIVKTIRALTTPPTITLEIILASQPDTVEASFTGFTLRNTNYDALVVEGELRLEETISEPFPAGTFNPNTTPGLF